MFISASCIRISILFIEWFENVIGEINNYLSLLTDLSVPPENKKQGDETEKDKMVEADPEKGKICDSSVESN